MLSKDERTLHVARGDIDRGDVWQLFAYEVSECASVVHAHALLTFTAVDRGIEGMCLDSEGNLIACRGWSKAGAEPAIAVVA